MSQENYNHDNATIICESLEKDFVIFARALCQDPHLSSDGHLVLNYLLSLPKYRTDENGNLVPWKINLCTIWKNKNISRDRTYAAVTECIKLGYMQRIVLKKGNLKSGVEYKVANFKKFFRYTEFQDPEIRDPENPDHKKNREKNNKDKKKLTNPQTPDPKAEPKKLVSFSLSEKEEILSDFELSSSQMQSLLSQTQELSLDVFKESIQAFLDYRKKTDVQSNFAVLWKALGCEGQEPWKAKDCDSIEDKNKAIADKLKIENGQTIQGWLFSRLNDCIEFSHACHSKVFEFSSHSFEKNLRGFLEKLGESDLLDR